MAIFLANTYSTGDTRLSMVKVCLDDRVMTPAEITQVLLLDINSVVSVTFTPNGIGDPIEQNCVVQGIDHDIDPEMHWVTLWLSKLDQSQVFILDDATYGLLNSAVGVLAF